VVGNNFLKEYLVNFSKNFIYTTALDTYNLLRVKHTYLYLQHNINQCVRLEDNIEYFKQKVGYFFKDNKLIGEGPVFGFLAPGTENCLEMAAYLQSHGYDIRSILSPTVPKGRERLRIILHSFNKQNEIDNLINILVDYHKNEKI
jgi:8-amino-7-oxononanoate synthase